MGLTSKDKLLLKDTCWICDGWQEQEFTFPGDAEPLFVHLQFENFKPVYIPKKNNSRIQLMVPPGRAKYFYTVNDNQVIATD